MKEIVNIIKSNRLFIGLKEKEIEKILRCSNAQILTYKDNQLVFEKDDRITKLGIVLEGEFNLVTQKYNGTRAIITTLEPNDLFGEALIFSSAETAPYDLVSSGTSKAIVLPNTFLISMCPEVCIHHKQLINNMLTILSDKIIMLNNKMNILNADSIKAKISVYLISLYKKVNRKIFDMPMKRQELADFLNVTRPSLSRELSNMQHDNIIEIYRSTVKILDLQKLYELAE